MRFEWDEPKADLNEAKHGVSFEEASSVFDDPVYVDFYDPEHSEHDEHRYIIIGESSERRLLMVSYTEREDFVRIISAREATRPERKKYERDRYFTR